MFHALMTSSMMSPGHKVDQILKLISPSIFQLERRSKAQNIENAHGYLAGIFNVQYYSQLKVCRKLKMAAILNTLTSDLKRVSQIRENNIFRCDDVINNTTG